MAKQYKSLHPLKYYRDYIAHNIRPDGRDLDKFRPIVVNAGTIKTANGSAIVKVGKTTVACGIKAELCTPKAEKPNEGFLIPNVELSPLCSSKFRLGPPCDQAQVLTKLIFDVIKHSECIKLEELCITKEKLAWCLYADVICLDYDGALIDACVIALVAALKTVKLPQVEHDSVLDKKEVNEEERVPLNVYCIPVSTTFAVFEDKTLLTDPTDEEENLCSGTLHIVVKNDELCTVVKPGGSPLTDESIIKCISSAKEHALHVKKLLDTILQDIK